MNYKLYKNIMTDDKKRASYDALAQQTFGGLSFENWYQTGFWSETNQPYTLFDGDKAVANVSLNRMEVEYEGRVRRYIQLGTVMTDEAYRNQGLSRYLMERVLADWQEKCDAIFLFANESVLDFYPKFGFEKAKQYACRMKVTNKMQEIRHGRPKKLQQNQMQDSCQGETDVNAGLRKLDMSDAGDIAFLKKYYDKKNPYSKLQAVNGFGLLMFYCASFMQDCVYYSKEADAVIIAEWEEATLHCYDVYCDGENSLQQVLSEFLTEETEEILFGFTPVDVLEPATGGGGKNTEKNNIRPEEIHNDDDTLFVLKGKENIFAEGRLLFPEISHT